MALMDDGAGAPNRSPQGSQKAFISEFNRQYRCCTSQAGRMLLLTYCLDLPPPEPTGNVAAAAAADPVDFEAMAEAIPLVETSAAACAKASTFS
jgi:hypothetical protein